MNEPGGTDPLELRLGVVMTGGVSLAVWMGGVTLEILHLVRASDRREPSGLKPTPLQNAYAELLNFAHTDVVVDVVTGTSAGGLNGVLLATALQCNTSLEQFDALRRLWLDIGSFDQLLRDPSEPSPPSLLDGDGVMLRAAEDLLTDWFEHQGSTPQYSDRERPEIKLRVTGTAITGQPELIMQSFGEPITETSHRVLFSFDSGDRRADGSNSDVARQLALAARSSASFPGAFEASYCPVGAGGPAAQRPDMRSVSNLKTSRFVLDGGVLMNQPIEPAIREIVAQPPTAAFGTRTLLYVNPDPREQSAPAIADEDEPPPLARVLWGSMSAVPRKQSVARELEFLREHNTRTEEQRHFRDALLGLSFETRLAVADASYRAFAERCLKRSVTRMTAQIMALHGDSEATQVVSGWTWREIRDALHVASRQESWLPATFPEPGTIDDGGDTSWAWGIGTLENLLGVAAAMVRHRASRLDLVESSPHSRALVYSARRRILGLRDQVLRVRELDNAYWDLRTSDLPPRPTSASAAVLQAWARRSYQEWPSISDARIATLRETSLPAADRYVSARENVVDAWALTWPRPPTRGLALLELLFVATELAKTVVELASLEEAETAAETGFQGSDFSSLAAPETSALPRVDETLRGLLAYHVIQLALGGSYQADERRIDLLQISANASVAIDPNRDRPSAGQRLAGAQLAHFGAFFKESWRANDWMWGRVNAIERLILAVVSPMALELKEARSDPDALVAEIAALVTGRHPPPGGVDTAAVNDETYAVLCAHWERVRSAVATEIGDFAARYSGRSTSSPSLPAALPHTAGAIAFRFQLEILREELPRIDLAIEASAAQGGKLSPDAQVFRSRLAHVRGADASIPSAQIQPMFGLCRVGQETVGEEIGYDLFTATASHALAVGGRILQGSRAGIGRLSVLFAPVRLASTAIYYFAQAAIRDSRTAFAATLLALLFGVGTVSAAIAGFDIPSVFVVVGGAFLIAALALIATSTGRLIPVVIVIVGLVVVGVTLAGEHTIRQGFVGAPEPGDWKQSLFDDSFGVAAGVAVAFFLLAALLLHRWIAASEVARKQRTLDTTGTASRVTVARRQRGIGTLVASAAAICIGAAALVVIPDELGNILTGNADASWQSDFAGAAETLHSYEWLVIPGVVILIPLLLEAYRSALRDARRGSVARPRTYRWSEALTFTAGTSAALVMVNVAAAVLSFDWWTRLILISLLTLGAALLFQQQPLRSVQALATTWHTLVQNAKRAWRGIVFGIPIAVLASGLAVALWRAGELRGLVDQLRTPEALHTDGWLYIGVGIIALAFVEELLFRRLILDQWGTVVTWATAVAANAVLFGAWHLGAALQGDRDIWEVVAQAVIPGLCAVPLCWLRRRTDTIAGCVFVHAAASGTVLLLI